jgi:hypothetical protein
MIYPYAIPLEKSLLPRVVAVTIDSPIHALFFDKQDLGIPYVARGTEGKQPSPRTSPSSSVNSLSMFPMMCKKIRKELIALSASRDRECTLEVSEFGELF